MTPKAQLLKSLFQQSNDLFFPLPLQGLISSKTKDEKIFPPYIPLVGESYEDYKVLAYATAQNIAPDDSLRELYECHYDKLIERLYYNKKFQRKYPEISFTDVAIYPFQTGVMVALLGVFLFAKYGVKIKNPNKIMDAVAASNYYKFSLHTGKHDIHPEPTGKNPITKYVKDRGLIHKYWNINDRLVCLETEILKPHFILVFKGRKAKVLQNQCPPGCRVFPVNDPSWILQGHGGHLSPGGSWHRYATECAGDEFNELVKYYLLIVSDRYYSKREALRTYLTYYYCKWKVEFKQSFFANYPM